MPISKEKYIEKNKRRKEPNLFQKILIKIYDDYIVRKVSRQIRHGRDDDVYFKYSIRFCLVYGTFLHRLTKKYPFLNFKWDCMSNSISYQLEEEENL